MSIRELKKKNTMQTAYEFSRLCFIILSYTWAFISNIEQDQRKKQLFADWQIIFPELRHKYYNREITFYFHAFQSTLSRAFVVIPVEAERKIVACGFFLIFFIIKITFEI